MSIYAPSISAYTQTANVATSQGTTSTTFADLATVGPSVTVNVGASGIVLVMLSADMVSSVAAGYVIASFVVSGANTIAASDAKSLFIGGGTSVKEVSNGVTFTLTGLSAGSTTFKMQYRVDTGTGTFLNRNISVVPL